MRAACRAVLVALALATCAPVDLTVLLPGGRADASLATTVGCLPGGAECTHAGACCSLACVAAVGAPARCQDDGPMCAVVGGPCTAATDCCSGVCSAHVCVADMTVATCSPAGESCTGGMPCCSLSCVAQRCALLSACRVVGELCDVGVDCCSGSCALGADGVLRCAALETCTTAHGDTCSNEVGEVCTGGTQCCSGRCLQGLDPVNRCAPGGGCVTACERCSADSDCCSGSCVKVNGVGTCQLQRGCGEGGEACTAASDCCADVPACVGDSYAGFNRCGVPGMSCLAGGATCAFSGECCTGFCGVSASALVCAAPLSVDYAPCRANGDCRTPSAVCSRLSDALVCIPPS
ncbi:MAG: hypothetical protein FWD17_00360 [Polyangiaceae bacterium]|nr:hypothetical protein [Polyangiaceae bacterium]